MMKNISVAIDGPAAAGKSTIAKAVAKILNFVYIDTGAMYRAFTYAVIKRGLDPKNEKESCSIIKDVTIDLLDNGTVLCNDEDVTRVIREKEVSSNVSYIASYKNIRLALVEMQRAMARSKNVIMDGRDIGTYVLPDADVKIYQIASVEKRAERRYLEAKEKGINMSYEDVLKDVQTRDHIDSSRAFAPLKQADDAIALDTSELSIEEVINEVLRIIKEKVGDIK
ncbi:MAG: (d)CMP kinase [Bacilli bacterium]|nr:(d)CMP kinase [Bacilli bacterium]MDY6430521.1 (d)CMP kinase [Bacilli bacterium]